MKMKNNCLLFSIIILIIWFPFSLEAQSVHKFSMKVPEGSNYTTLSIDDDFIPCITTNSKGAVYYVIKNHVVNIRDKQQIELPTHCRPTSICWTKNDKLVFFSNDTLFVTDKGLSFRSVLSVATPKPIIHPIGKDDFAFCVKNDTVLYRYYYKSDSLAPVIALDHPIRDFIVDDEDFFIAYGNRVIALSQEKELIPVLMDEEPIYNIAFCGNQSLLYSTPSGLWYVNNKREKELLHDRPIIDMMTDEFDRAFFMLQDGTWLLLSPISTYETEQE